MNYHYTSDPNNNSNNELNVKLPEYFTDNVRQHNTALPKRLRTDESELQREMRHAKDAARAAARRRRETTPERRKRLANSASHIAMKRKTESDDQRRMRLAKDAARTAERRRRETYAERETRLALDAARHATKRHTIEDRVGSGSTKHLHDDVNNNMVRSSYTPSPFGSSAHQAYHGDGAPHHNHPTSHHSPAPSSSSSHHHIPHPDQSRSQASSLSRNESKYGNLLNVIEDLGREIKPTYAGSKMSQDRLRKGIMHARELVRGCLAEVEKKMR